MCVCILLALMFFLTLIYRLTPPTSTSIPLITKYLLFTFIMHIVAITGCVIVLNWNFRNPRTHTMPRWVRIVFLNYLPRLLLMARPTPEEQQRERTHYLWSRRTMSSNGKLRFLQRETLSGTSNSFTNFSPQPAAEHPAGSSSMPPGQGGEGEGGGRQGCDISWYESAAVPPWSHECHQRAGAGPRPGTPYTMHTAVDAISFIASHLKSEDDFDEVSKPQFIFNIVLCKQCLQKLNLKIPSSLICRDCR